MSTKTLAQILTNVRQRLDDTNAAAYSFLSPELRQWTNDGCKDLVRRTECLQTTAVVTAVAGTQQYTLANDVIRVYRAEYAPSGNGPIYPLEYRDFNNMDAVWWTQQAVTQSTPSLFTLWGFPPSLKLIVYPKPATAGTFNIYYYRLPAELATDGTADSTLLDVPVGWDDAVTDYVEYMALRKDRDPRWKDAKTLYEEHVNALMELSIRWTDQSGGPVTPDMNMGLPWWLVGGGD